MKTETMMVQILKTIMHNKARLGHLSSEPKQVSMFK